MYLYHGYIPVDIRLPKDKYIIFLDEKIETAFCKYIYERFILKYLKVLLYTIRFSISESRN